MKSRGQIMSRIRNMISLVLAAAMLLGMTAVAMAAGENTITVSGVKAGEEYSIYKTSFRGRNAIC